MFGEGCSRVRGWHKSCSLWAVSNLTVTSVSLWDIRYTTWHVMNVFTKLPLQYVNLMNRLSSHRGVSPQMFGEITCIVDQWRAWRGARSMNIERYIPDIGCESNDVVYILKHQWLRNTYFSSVRVMWSHATSTQCFGYILNSSWSRSKYVHGNYSLNAIVEQVAFDEGDFKLRKCRYFLHFVVSWSCFDIVRILAV